MTEVHRTRLEWARDAARAYRRIALRADPEACARLDEQCIDAGQRWVAPQIIPLAVAEEAIVAKATPAEIARMSGIPVGTIYSWISRGLLKPADPEEHPARYWVRDVAGFDARRRRASA